MANMPDKEKRFRSADYTDEQLSAMAKKNREKCGAAIKKAQSGSTVKVQDGSTIPVPKTLEAGKQPTDDQRATLEVFIKRYLVETVNCKKSDATDLCEAKFGYTYRVEGEPKKEAVNA